MAMSIDAMTVARAHKEAINGQQLRTILKSKEPIEIPAPVPADGGGERGNLVRISDKARQLSQGVSSSQASAETLRGKRGNAATVNQNAVAQKTAATQTAAASQQVQVQKTYGNAASNAVAGSILNIKG